MDFGIRFSIHTVKDLKNSQKHEKISAMFSQARKLTTIGLIPHDSYTPSID